MARTQARRHCPNFHDPVPCFSSHTTLKVWITCTLMLDPIGNQSSGSAEGDKLKGTKRLVIWVDVHEQNFSQGLEVLLANKNFGADVRAVKARTSMTPGGFRKSVGQKNFGLNFRSLCFLEKRAFCGRRSSKEPAESRRWVLVPLVRGSEKGLARGVLVPIRAQHRAKIAPRHGVLLLKGQEEGCRKEA